MQKLILTTALIALPLVAQGATYEIDPPHANVRFYIDHFGTSTNAGGFYNLTGTVDYDRSAKKGAVDITIPMDNLNTGITHFDESLKSKDFFNIETYPTARFVSTDWQFRQTGDKKDVAQVTGNLTLNGQTHPVTLTATKFNCYLSPIHKAQVCGGDFLTTIDRTNWGIDKYVAMGVSKLVTLNIQIEAIKK